MGDQNRKTLRSFYCRDYLWELFEVMTNDLGCSMDYLVNEAMRHYARSRNYSLAAAPQQAQPKAAPTYGQQPSVQPKPARRPPPLPSPAVQSPAQRKPLFLLFNGQRYRIDKDQFVIGRGSQMTDLTIRDGNISRKHCEIVHHKGQFYIRDLGSTNGIEFNGNRVDQKRVDEGDIFYLCDYELRFTYR